MKDYNNNNNSYDKRGSGRPNYNNNNRGDSRSAPREMFPAVCDNCGRDCKVPFKPSANKQVYCSDCFERMNGNERNNNNNSDRSEPRNYQKTDYRDRQENHAPRREENSGSGSTVDLKRQIDAINVKLNQILQLLESQSKVQPDTVREVVSEKKASAEVEKPKAKVKKVATKKKKTDL